MKRGAGRHMKGGGGGHIVVESEEKMAFLCAGLTTATCSPHMNMVNFLNANSYMNGVGEDS